ncbi:MAG TPA: hypothetical protein VLV49_10550 [Terriglobales bacterium]|nr:hypothetical protein [Terriglobales bacterium]
MASVSAARKAGVVARVASRMAVQRAARSRLLNAVYKAGRTTATHFWRVLHQLWLEVTGFVFLGLAGIGVIAFTRELVKYQAGKEGVLRAVVAIVFTLLFAWFGVTSFWRVRKKR